jgi:HEAT repeat protein
VSLLEAIGPDASDAQAKLLEIVRDPANPGQLRFQATIALANVSPIDEPIIPRLLEAFRRDAKGDIPLLVRPGLWPAEDDETDDSLMNPDHIRLEFFIRSGREPIEVPALLELVGSHSQKNVRATAIAILGALGPEAEAALPKLRECLADEDRDVRKYAAAAIVKIERDHTAVPAIIKKLELDEDTEIVFRKSADTFFAEQAVLDDHTRQEFADRPQIAWQSLEQMLKNGTPSQQRFAIQSLGKFGPAAAIAIPELNKALKAPELETRKAAKIALDAIDKSANP